jgi:regulator of replication initiation timing
MTRPNDIEDLKREIERLRDANRRWMRVANERSKEAAGLRLENEQLKARLAECDHRRV